MTVYLVGAGPGDPGLLTVRGAELLARADVVIYDRLSVASLLDLAPAGAERISVGKTPRGPSTPQEEINRLLVEHGRSAEVVVRLKGGDVFVFARGGEEAEALGAAGVDFEIVPGISSAIAVPAYAGIPVTHRGLSTSFTVVTGHEDPWAATETDWQAVARVGGTIVVLMGAATRGAIAERLMDGGLSPGTPVASVRWGTRANQMTVRTTLAELGAAAVEAPSTIVIGEVAGLDLAWFDKRPLFGRRIVVTRSRDQSPQLRYQLEGRGAEVIEIPTIAVEAIAEAGAATAARLAGADWVVFSSANGVAALTSHLRDARAFGSALVAAIGPGTAAALSSFGIAADLVPGRHVAEGLVDEFPAGNGRVVVAQAADARDVLAEGLRAKGWEVEATTVYRTVSASVDHAQRRASAGADAITFTSSSTVTNFVAAAGIDAVPPTVVAIGPVTAETARELGLVVTAVADPYTVAGVVDALVSTLASRSSGT